MDKLFVVSADTRMLYGNTSASTPSRFIEEMPEELVHRVAAGEATASARAGNDG